MLRKVIFIPAILLSAMLICQTTPSIAATPEDAKKVVEEFISYAKQHGLKAALKEVKPDGLFGVSRRGGAYIFVIDMNGVMVAHGANPKLTGKNLINLRDVKGKYLIREMINTVKTKGSGFVEYYWINPKTKRISLKVSYVTKLGDYVVGAGVYVK